MSLPNNKPPMFEIVLRLVPGQPLLVAGPLNDKILCYGMLEMARDAVRDYVPPAIEVPKPGLIDVLNKKHDDHRH